MAKIRTITKEQAEKIRQVIINAYRDSKYTRDITYKVYIEEDGAVYEYGWAGEKPAPYEAWTGEDICIATFSPCYMVDVVIQELLQHGVKEFIETFIFLGLCTKDIPEFERWVVEKYKDYLNTWEEEIPENLTPEKVYEDEEFICGELDFSEFKKGEPLSCVIDYCIETEVDCFAEELDIEELLDKFDIIIEG